MSFAKRLINLTFQIGEGQFGESGTNVVKLTGLRVSARIAKAGGNSMGTAQLSVFGMTSSKMNDLSTLGLRPTTTRKNTVTVEAGDEGGAMSAVFDGTITNAWTDYQGSPDVPFVVTAHTGRFEALKAVPPTSYRGRADVATILSGLATLMGKKFENNGVTATVSNPYYPGTAREQALACVKQAGISWNGLDDGTLAIWPSGKSRDSVVPLISAATGLIGYPSFTSQGISFKTLFNPSLGLGRKIKMDSFVTPACGEWVAYSLGYSLDSKVPRGSWYAEVSAARPGYVVVRG